MKPFALAPTVFWAAALAAQTRVSPAWLAEHKGDPGLVVIHAGMDRAGYDAGHVPGAGFASVMAFHAHGASRLPAADEMSRSFAAVGMTDRSRIVITGDPLSTSLAFLALDYLGAGDRVLVLDGGLAGWKAAGLPMSRDSIAVTATSFQGSPHPDLVVDADWIASRLGRPGIVLLDARSKPEYDGTTTAEGLPRPGHIPGAKHLEWRTTFRPGTEQLLPLDSLRARLQAAGVAPGDTVVTYCTVGMRASHLFLVARELGLPVRIYVGSMADWSPREALPVVTAKEAAR